MADMLSILIVVTAVYFAAKKLIIPRIAAVRAAKAKKPEPVEPVMLEGAAGSVQAWQAVSQARAVGHPVTCFDMRLLDVSVDDLDEHAGDILRQRITCEASEMLLNASTRGDNVRLSFFDWSAGYMMLYVTYTVR